MKLDCLFPSRVMRPLTWLALGLALAGPGLAGPQRSPAIGARGVVIPCYSTAPAPPTLLGTLRIGEVGLDHRRLGFFRVQVRPFVVAREVRVVLAEAARFEVVMAELGRNLHQLGSGLDVDLIDFRVVRTVERAEVPWIQAQSARVIRQESRVFLALENVILRQGTNELVLPRAQLGIDATDASLHWRVGDRLIHYEPSQSRLTTNQVAFAPPLE
jgi:hypothetical protein